MRELALVVIAGAIFLLTYAYVLYPAALRLLRLLGVGPGDPPGGVPAEPSGPRSEWPTITFSIPMYNEESQARDLLESILAIDYPEERRQVLVVSDASSDRTDEIVRQYADRGVELVRLAERSGKTAAEAEAAERARGEIIINTDASIRIHRDAVKRLVARFDDPAVGLASGRDISITRATAEENVGEAAYVDYEMGVRAAETGVRGIVGASGCLYAIRAELHRKPLPIDLSRDFAAALHAQEDGYRAISVSGAVCYVPRTASLGQEYRRKVRTIGRGMHTLWHKRQLLSPFRHGLFAWMLFSHKVCRWAIPWAAVAAFVALGVLALTHDWAAVLFAVGVVGVGTAGLSWVVAVRRPVPKVVRVLAFALMSNVAALEAAVRLLGGRHQAVWEPTRRESASA